MIKIGIVDDHVLILNGLERMLNGQGTCEIVFTASSRATLLEKLQQIVPDVLLLDIELPDANGADICSELRRQYPMLKIIALTNHDEIMWVRKMMRGGANGYLLKGTDCENLTAAIQTVCKGGEFLDREIEKAILQQTLSHRRPSGQAKLTNRENEILALIAQEHSNQQIADKLFLSIRTVESHRHSLHQKLQIKTTAGLVKEAILRGLI